MANNIHKNDLPRRGDFGSVVAIECRTTGPDLHWDRPCLIQMAFGDGRVDLVRIGRNIAKAPRLGAMLENPDILKIFHRGRFDIAMMYKAFDALAQPVWCANIASKLVRTYTGNHDLGALLKEFVAVDGSEPGYSDWGAETLTDAQIEHAAGNVVHLLRLREILRTMLERERRVEMAGEYFDLLPRIARLDVVTRPGLDIFAH